MADEKRLDFSAGQFDKLRETVKKGIEDGFKSVIGTLNREGSLLRQQSDRHHDQDVIEERNQRVADRLSDRSVQLKSEIENRMMLKGAVTTGMAGMQQKLYKYLYGQQVETSLFFTKLAKEDDRYHKTIYHKVDEAFREVKGLLKYGVTNFLETFTGPFYSVFKGFGKLVFSGLRLMAFKAFGNPIAGITNWLGAKVLSKLPMMPKPKPVNIESTQIKDVQTQIADNVFSILDVLRQARDTLIVSDRHQKDYTQRILESLQSINLRNKNKGNITVTMGRGKNKQQESIEKPSSIKPINDFFRKDKGSLIFESKTLLFFDFLKEQYIELMDIMHKLWHKIEKGEVGGGGGGFLDTLLGTAAGGGLYGMLKTKGAGAWTKAKGLVKSPAAKMLGKGLAVLDAGVVSYKGIKEEMEGKKIEKASDIIPKGFLNKLDPFEYLSRGGRYLGNKFNKGYGYLSEHANDKGIAGSAIRSIPFLGTLASMGTGSLGTNIFNLKDVFSKSLKDLKDSIMKSILGFFGGMNVSDVLTSVLSNLLPGGAGLYNILKTMLPKADVGGLVRRTGAAIVHEGEKIVPKKLVELGSRLGDTVKGFFKLADQGVNVSDIRPELKGALASAINEYRQVTGKNVTVTSGYRDAAKQASLSGNKYITAKPGMSMHQYGWAVDVNSADASAMDQMGILAKYGLTRPYGGRDPVHIELSQYANPAARAALREGQVPGQVAMEQKPTPKVAKGGFIEAGGIAELHKGEVVVPKARVDRVADEFKMYTRNTNKIERNTDNTQQYATGYSNAVAPNKVTETTTSPLSGEAIKYLAAIANGINKLISNSKPEPTATLPNAGPNNSPQSIPDMPADPGIIFGGNYFPQKGRQWR